MADSTVENVFQIVQHLVMLALGGAAVLLFLNIGAAVLGAALLITSGSAPLFLQPFGGWLTQLFATILEIVVVLGTIVVAWLVLTGQFNEMMDDIVEQGSETTRSRQAKRTRTKQTNATNTASSKTRSDTEEGFDEYGQIQ